MISPLWADLHSRRWEWADDAFSEFREQLDPGFRAHFPDRRRDVSIVLYGPSQSGKSTLLLRLLGIEDANAFSTVQRVLRAGRSPGKSVTCTPTRYHWSASDDRWEFALPDADLVTIDGTTLQTELARIREAVERGTHRGADRPADIGIPQRFRGRADSSLWPHVLDLPGTNPRNDSERAHAVRVAERHVATAHVIVLVTKSHGLTPLQPEVLEVEMPPLAMWTVAPHRFRVVLTHAVSNSSVQRLIARHGVTIDSLRQHHLAELTDAIRAPADTVIDPASVYPVEYGDSWSALKRDSPAVWVASEPVVNAVIDQLAGSLTGLDSQQMRLLAALRARPVLAAATHRRMLELGRARERVEADLQRQLTHQTRVADRIRAAQRARDRCDEQLLNARRSAQLAAAITVDEKPGEELATPTSNSAAREYNDNCRDAFVRGAREAWLEWASNWSTEETLGRSAAAFLEAGLTQLAEETFDTAVDCCGKCDTRWYYIPHWFEPDPDHCSKRHRERMPAASSALTAQLRARAAGPLVAPIAAIEQRYQAASAELGRRQGVGRKADERLARTKETLRGQDDALEAAARQHQVALAHAAALEHRLTQRWRARTNELMTQLAGAQDEEHRAHLALAILLAHRTRDSLRSPDSSEAQNVERERDV